MMNLNQFIQEHRMSNNTYYLNRTLCDVLSEMRKCDKTRNYSYLAGLIEEAQSMGNRMESALSDVDDLIEMKNEWHELKTEIKLAREELSTLLPEEDDDGDDS
jgi:hypothetical protein